MLQRSPLLPCYTITNRNKVDSPKDNIIVCLWFEIQMYDFKLEAWFCTQRNSNIYIRKRSVYRNAVIETLRFYKRKKMTISQKTQVFLVKNERR